MLAEKSINLGFGNMIPSGRITTIVSADSLPTKRIIQEARKQNRLIDVTNGRKTRSIIIIDSAHVLLSAIPPETVAERLHN
ncbi:extracellular matrix/biofilm biosynthesis regulator RemA family protein [Aliibacillus thermotolerans]|uniref:Putative regulatory protein ACFPTR_05135 n=1 Tax=Aliibacillus thermotolerans TaxID=1834418 RepID=A0ABW0U682_9BACI